jgi:hypothetical protein
MNCMAVFILLLLDYFTAAGFVVYSPGNMSLRKFAASLSIGRLSQGRLSCGSGFMQSNGCLAVLPSA